MEPSPTSLSTSVSPYLEVSASSNPACAACKHIRRKCHPGCIFSPYFPPDHRQQFLDVQRVFGASNVSKFLQRVPPDRRHETAESLVFEARHRLLDPVYGCVGYIMQLEGHVQGLQQENATLVNMFKNQAQQHQEENMKHESLVAFLKNQIQQLQRERFDRFHIKL